MARLAVPPYLIAYFSMEVGIEPQIPTYSGGLGVLAGDTLRAAAIRRPNQYRRDVRRLIEEAMSDATAGAR